jgi:hypothetical protein
MNKIEIELTKSFVTNSLGNHLIGIPMYLRDLLPTQHKTKQ